MSRDGYCTHEECAEIGDKLHNIEQVEIVFAGLKLKTDLCARHAAIVKDLQLQQINLTRNPDP